MKNKIKLFLLIFLLIFLVGCKDKPIDNDNNNTDNQEDNPIINEEEESYIQVVFQDENGKLIASKLFLKDDTITLIDCPSKEYYDSEWVLVSKEDEKIVYQLNYTLNTFNFNINYNIGEEETNYSSKEEMSLRFLMDFYQFVNPNEELVTFLYGNDLTATPSIKNGNYKNYLGGSVGSINKLIYNNDIDVDNDEYFFNSKQYKDKWYHLASYVRNSICNINKRFGYNTVEYNYGALDFYRYLVNDPGSYIASYGGESVFYNYPKATFTYKTSYEANSNEYLLTPYNKDFLGWYKDKALTDGPYYSLSEMVGDLDLYPKWRNNKYKVSFLDDNGEIIEVMNVNKNEAINLPTIEKEKAVFLGWYLQNTKLSNFNYNYDCDITINARWNYDDVNDLIDLEYDGKIVYYNDSSISVKVPEYYEEKEENSEELRATWVSSIVGGFTPSKYEVTMKAELTKVLDVLEDYHINCIFFHLRTHNNAFYQTKLAPISSSYGTYESFNTFDYLPWLIEECHKRGIEFHAWLNPYRIANSGYSQDVTVEEVAEEYKNYPLNPASKKENILLTNGDGETRGAILNPAKQEVIDYLNDVVTELITNYDIDGIHFDDYFYAKLNSTSVILDDDDQAEYLASLKSGEVASEEDKGDWRRENVNKLIYKLHQTISEYNKKNNKTIQLGISPTCGYKRGDGSVESGANVSYGGHYSTNLYCDTYLWAKNEWVDYIMPQLYVALVYGRNSFADFADWWNRAFEGLNCNLYFGLSNYKILNESLSWNDSEEIFNQLKYIQTLTNCKGVSLYSSTYLVNDTLNTSSKTYLIYQRLKNEFWTRTMKVPSSRIN